jgi:hypothetical protein
VTRPTVYLAAEDEPGLAVGRKLVAEVPPLAVYREENARGYGRLKSKVKNFQIMAKHGLPVLMLTDLDRGACPVEKISDWLGATPERDFLFRICVREVEAWLIADREALACFFGLRASLVPANPERLADPKAAVIALAQRSRLRRIRVGFKPVGSSTIGPDYNQLLGNFIRESWNARVAAQHAPSLARARTRLRLLANTVTP